MRLWRLWNTPPGEFTPLQTLMSPQSKYCREKGKSMYLVHRRKTRFQFTSPQQWSPSCWILLEASPEREDRDTVWVFRALPSVCSLVFVFLSPTLLLLSLAQIQLWSRAPKGWRQTSSRQLSWSHPRALSVGDRSQWWGQSLPPSSLLFPPQFLPSPDSSGSQEPSFDSRVGLHDVRSCQATGPALGMCF